MKRWYYDDIAIDYTDEEFARLEKARKNRAARGPSTKTRSTALSKAMRDVMAPKVREIRIKIVDAVREGTFNRQEIADQTGVHRSTVKKHLNEMRDMGIVSSGKRDRKIELNMAKVKEELYGDNGSL